MTLLRLAAAVLVLAYAAILALAIGCCPVRRWRRALAQWSVRTVCRSLLAALGITRCHRGPRPVRGALLVANHLSWLDIVASLAEWQCTCVAKREVRSWPVIGSIGEALGVVWIDRARPRDLLRVIPAMTQALSDGRIVLLFPEGTTSDGRVLLPFRSALFEAAVRGALPVVPLAISASAVAGDVDALAWYGSESLVANLWRVASLERIQLTLHVGAPVSTNGDRKRAARDAHREVARRYDAEMLRPALVSERRARSRISGRSTALIVRSLHNARSFPDTRRCSIP